MLICWTNSIDARNIVFDQKQAIFGPSIIVEVTIGLFSEFCKYYEAG